jgi:hypothetical protein
MANVRPSAVEAAESSGWSDLTTGMKARRLAFSVVAVATLVLAAVMMRGELVLAFTGWTQDLGMHQVHDMTIFGMLWIALLLPMALALYRPAQRVNSVLAPLVFLVPVAAFAALVASPILMLPLIFGTLGVLALVFHPAGRDVLRFDRVEDVPRLLAGLLVVAAVPLLVYAGGQTLQQLTVGDEHAMFAHYGGMAVASVYVVIMGALAVFRQRDWRFAAWTAGLVAALVGATGIAFTVESSVGPLWGGLLVAWAVVFVAGVEYERRVARDERSVGRETVAPSD